MPTFGDTSQSFLQDFWPPRTGRIHVPFESKIHLSIALLNLAPNFVVPIHAVKLVIRSIPNCFWHPRLTVANPTTDSAAARARELRTRRFFRIAQLLVPTLTPLLFLSWANCENRNLHNATCN